MMNLLKRIWNFLIGKGNKAMDLVENKLEEAQTKLIEMKRNHSKMIDALASLKSVSLRYGTDIKKFEAKAEESSKNAKLLKDKYEKLEDGNEKEEIKKYILIALNKVENSKDEANKFTNLKDAQDEKVSILAEKVKAYSEKIKTVEASLKTKKAELEASKINKETSKDISAINFEDGIDNILDNIDDEISDNNISADSWSETSNSLKSDEDKMKDILSKSSKTEDSKLFTEFMSN